jgi:hypothetical protein
MGYGMEVEAAGLDGNAGDIIIDSDQPYSSLGIKSFNNSTSLTTTTSAGQLNWSGNWNSPDIRVFYSQNYPSGVANMDLFFVRLPKSGFVMRELSLSSVNFADKFVHYGTSTNYSYREMDVMSGVTINNWNSGYGLNVYKDTYTGTPQQSDLVFSSQQEAGINIVAVGNFMDLGASYRHEITVNSTEPHYVLMNGSSFNYGLMTSATIMGYEFEYQGTTDTLNKIYVWASTILSYGVFNKIALTGYESGRNSSYMVIKITGE